MLCNHVGRFVVCKCGTWSTTKVKVMRVRAHGPEAVKDERQNLTEGPESPGDYQWWLTPRTRTHMRTW
jgi:hypothetical protein